MRPSGAGISTRSTSLRSSSAHTSSHDPRSLIIPRRLSLLPDKRFFGVIASFDERAVLRLDDNPTRLKTRSLILAREVHREALIPRVCGQNHVFEKIRLTLDGVDSKETVVHSVATTAASVADKHMLPDLLHGEERKVWGDAGRE